MVAVVHVLQTRERVDFLLYGGGCTAVFLIIFLKMKFDHVTSRGSDVLDSVLDYFAAVFFSIFGGMIAYGIGASVKDLFLWTVSPEPTFWQALVSVVLVVGFAVILFRLRGRYRATDGLTEALVGVVAAIQRSVTPTTVKLSGEALILAYLTASIYLIIRGLENMEKGVKEEPKDPFALSVIALVNRHVR